MKIIIECTSKELKESILEWLNGTNATDKICGSSIGTGFINANNIELNQN